MRVGCYCGPVFQLGVLQVSHLRVLVCVRRACKRSARVVNQWPVRLFHIFPSPNLVIKLRSCETFCSDSYFYLIIIVYFIFNRTSADYVGVVAAERDCQFVDGLSQEAQGG